MKVHSQQLSLYAITAPSADLAAKVRAAIAGGITMLQIREKNLIRNRLIELAYPLVSLCKAAGIPVIIDNDVQAAKILGADGVHLGQRDMKCTEARRILGEDFIIGVSAHTVEEAKRAEADGADYLGCGAVFPTASKHDATPLTLETLHAIKEAVSVPVCAIGGITANNLPRLNGTGADGVAVSSALFAAPDPEAAAQALLKLVQVMRASK